MNVNFTGWENPVCMKQVPEIYEAVYHEEGREFLRILESSPYEMMVLSRLLAYLDSKKEREG